MKEHFIVKGSTRKKQFYYERKKQFYYEKKISLGKKNYCIKKASHERKVLLGKESYTIKKKKNIRKRKLYYINRII